MNKKIKVCDECGREKPYYRPSITPGYGPHCLNSDDYCFYCLRVTSTLIKIQDEEPDYSQFRSLNKPIPTPFGIFQKDKKDKKDKKKVKSKVKVATGPKYPPNQNSGKTEREKRIDWEREQVRRKENLENLREQILWEVENYKEEEDENVIGMYFSRSDMLWEQIFLAEEAGFEDNDPLIMWLYKEAAKENEGYEQERERNKKEIERLDKEIELYLKAIRQLVDNLVANDESNVEK
jgi:hypothetical protein